MVGLSAFMLQLALFVILYRGNPRLVERNRFGCGRIESRHYGGGKAFGVTGLGIDYALLEMDRFGTYTRYAGPHLERFNEKRLLVKIDVYVNDGHGYVVEIKQGSEGGFEVSGLTEIHIRQECIVIDMAKHVAVGKTGLERQTMTIGKVGHRHARVVAMKE